MSCETSHGRATVTQLCQAFGISRQAYYMARQSDATTGTPDRVGEAGSRMKSHGSKASPTPARRGAAAHVVATETLRAAIIEIVRENVGWGTRKVWATLGRRGMHASRKRVWAVMKANGLTLEPTTLRETPGRYGHVAVPESNRRWGTDFTTTWTRADGVVAITPTIDYGDRFTLALTVTKSQESPAVLAGVESALRAEFGIPSRVPHELELRSDHGPQYTGDDAAKLCAQWNVHHTFAPVGRPTGNAIAERFIQTMKIELIWTQDWESLAQLRAALQIWLLKYNHERPHQSLGWLTPAEQRAKNLGRPLNKAA